MGSQEPLKDAQIKVNLDEQTMSEFKAEARSMGLTPTAMARLLAEQFVWARKKHGSHMVWPPKYQYYTVGPVTEEKDSEHA